MGKKKYKKFPKELRKINGGEVYPFLFVFFATIVLTIKGVLE